MSPSEGGKPSTILALDGVRAFATIAVITFHINSLVANSLWDMPTNPLSSAFETFGGSGVTLFFVLSGFLLFMPYAKALLFQTHWPSARRFYLRRVLRIIPGYYVALVLMILLFQRQYLQPNHWRDLLLFFTFFMDSSAATWRQLNGPFWTLAIEWQFYLLLPLIALGFSYIAGRFVHASPHRRLLVMLSCCLVLIVGGLTVRYAGGYLMQHPRETFHMPPLLIRLALFFLYGQQGKYLENFAVGMAISLCYVFTQHPAFGQELQAKMRHLSMWIWRFGVLVLTFTAIWHYQVLVNNTSVFTPFFGPLTAVFDWLNEMMIALGYGACMAAILFGCRGLKALFEWPPMRWIGLISYGLYMWHLPLLLFFRDQILQPYFQTTVYQSYALYWLWAVVVIVPVALASYMWVEKPWLKLGSRSSSKLVFEKKVS